MLLRIPLGERLLPGDLQCMSSGTQHITVHNPSADPGLELLCPWAQVLHVWPFTQQGPAWRPL